MNGRSLVTMEVLCRADPDLRGVWVLNHPDLPSESLGRRRIGHRQQIVHTGPRQFIAYRANTGKLQRRTSRH
jgi:hypothetical protein